MRKHRQDLNPQCRNHTFFYIDPTYYDSENYYGDGIFAKSDFELLATRLSSLKGKFLLSLNDVPEVRDVFSDFIIEPVSVVYSCGKVLIRNYDLMN